METVDGYKLADQFHKDVKDQLLEIPLSHSKELWLIQWPDKQDPDFDGQEVPIELNHDGQLAIFKSSSGISYEMVSYASQEPDAVVFLSSATEAKIAGKVSRRVSLVRYPKLSELDETAKEKAKPDLFARKSSRTRGTVTPSKSTGGKRGTSPAFGGISRGTLGDPSKKKKKTKEETE